MPAFYWPQTVPRPTMSDYWKNTISPYFYPNVRDCLFKEFADSDFYSQPQACWAWQFEIFVFTQIGQIWLKQILRRFVEILGRPSGTHSQIFDDAQINGKLEENFKNWR